MAEQEVTNTENRIWLPEDAIGLVTTSSELENVEGAWWVREARAAEGQAAQVKALLAKYDEWYESPYRYRWQLEEIFVAALASFPATAPHEPHEVQQ